ncbi:MAG: histidine kinase dimerization/phospho-acceptor domain-containing protein, partial [Vicinamibacterales bacterium]
MTLRVRLVVWFTGTLSAILLIFCGALLWLQPQMDIAILDEELANDVITVSGVLATETREIGPGREAVAGMLDELHLPNRGIAVFDAAGALLGAQWNELDGGEAMRLTPTAQGTWTYPSPQGDARMHVEAITSAEVPYRIAVAASLEEVAHESAMLRRAVIVAVPIALLLTAIGGAVAARQANDLLDRLNLALEQQRRFMADASHELRTPVSVVRTAADVMLARDSRSEQDYRESFAIVSEQARRLSRMVEDMFLLARVDAGQRRVVAGEFYLDEVVSECVRSSQLLAADKHVTIDTDIRADVSYSGDETLARQLVTNLLDNAVRHAPRGGRVWVSLAVSGSSMTLSV